LDDLTRAPGEALSDTATLSSSSGTGWGRFAPGTLLAGRFRIVAPLGRGGMGEVYRADDLKLGQTVALKFLPDDLMHDPGRLAQFHNEVRVARTIAHRNVCRMYDIGDADGRPFLTMEYVDGEDLSSLLRRIGRFPQEKATEVARQICAGVAAAHERGVLHRDLKPANVMIDSEGHVRLTDFGLAAVVGSVENIRAGTPAYMAPEQLAGREVTQRSDIYALGLVLYELYTGKRFYEATTLDDLVQMHESGATATPSSLVRDLDPTIERAIQRCLERDPARRPVSALAVSAALPGGDQLAAALAAGETPSPEMVAAAGEQSAVQPGIGLALVVFTLVMLAILVVTSQRFAVMNRIPLPKTTDSLHDRAQEILERLGYTAPPYDTVQGWLFKRDYLGSDAARRDGDEMRRVLETGRTGTVSFWYRTSPAALVSTPNSFLPTTTDPAFVSSNMRMVYLDPHGRLIEFQALPPQVEEVPDAAAAAPDWQPLFDAAGLDRSAFHEVEPRWLPRGHADVRAAWEGPLPDVAGTMMRVEAAAYRGQVIFFNAIAPWTRPTRNVTPPPATLGSALFTVAGVISMLIMIAGAFLARRHLRTGRGDRTGAFRTAAIIVVTQVAALFLRARHYASFDIESSRLSAMMAFALLDGVAIWLLYMAFEPYVRRFWPTLLIGWTRLLSGRMRDPLVGRDVLVGAAAGTIAAMLTASREILPSVLGLELVTPGLPPATILLGTRYEVVAALETLMRAFDSAFEVVCVVVFLRIVVRHTWLVLLLGTIVTIPVAMNGSFAGEHLVLELAIVALGIALIFGVLLRFGLLSLIVTFYTFMAMEAFPLTTNLSRPYANSSVLLVLAITAVAAFGFYASRGNEPLFGHPLLD
jgi:serine/threonine-protein kinase